MGKTRTLGISLGARAAVSRHVFPKFQATLEKCAKCQGLITEHIVRALGKGYHPSCFSCAACGRAIGTESFAVDEQGDVYCVPDYYRLAMGEGVPHWELGSARPRHPAGLTLPPLAPIRKYAVVCSACERPIVPHEDEDTYKIECLGRSFHESCYRCEVRPRGMGGPQSQGGGTEPQLSRDTGMAAPTAGF